MKTKGLAFIPIFGQQIRLSAYLQCARHGWQVVGEEMAETRPLLSRSQGSLSDRREEERAESDGSGCYFIFYGGQSRPLTRKVLGAKPEGCA